MRDNIYMVNKRRPRVNPLFAKAFQKRTKLLREGAGLSQGDMANRLRITLDSYKKYESRPNSLLPHEHVAAFVQAVGGNTDDIAYLFTGSRINQQPVAVSDRLTFAQDS